MHRDFVEARELKPRVHWQKGEGQEVVLGNEPRARWQRPSDTMLQSSDLILNHREPAKVF